MYMVCNRCENKHFLVDIKRQEGKEDTYEFVCAGCGDCIDTPEVDEYRTYLVSEIAKLRNKDESICLEEWVEEGAVVYYVSLYKDDVLIGYKDFNTVDEAGECYKKCTDIFDSLGSLDTVVTLFDDC